MAANEYLNSWNEIADYLNRGVRTVQRWEKEIALPVRRPHGKDHSKVFAIRSEIDEWLRSRPTKPPDRVLDHGAVAAKTETVPLSTLQLLVESRRLRDELRRSTIEFLNAVATLRATVAKLVQNSSQARALPIPHEAKSDGSVVAAQGQPEVLRVEAP